VSNRREFITLLGGAVVSWVLVTGAGHAGALPQSGLTSIKDKSEDGVLRSTLRRRLFIKNYAVSIDGVFGRSGKHLLRLP
jgi:hypothetical protein